MRASPRITRVEATTFETTLPDLGTDDNTFNLLLQIQPPLHSFT